MNVLVTDATGYLGRRLLHALQKAGHSVKCLVRETSESSGVVSGARTFRATAGEVIRQALDGIAVAYVLCTPPKPDELYAELLTAVRMGPLRRIIILGRREDLAAVPHWLDLLRAYGAEVLRVEHGPLFGIGSPLFEAVRYAAERLPILPCTAWMCGPIYPIEVADVVRRLTALSSGSVPESDVVIEGAESITFEELVRSYSRCRGLRRLSVHVPGSWPRVSARLLGFISPVPKAEIARLIESASLPAARCAAASIGNFRREPWQAVVDNGHVPAVRSDLRAGLNRACHTVVRREGFVIGIWETLVPATRDALFASVESIGGEHGWYFADDLWRLRGLMDRAMGGAGMQRRRDPVHLARGDTFDFWVVEQIEPGTSVRLRARMRMPGRAWLGFECVPRENHTTLLRTIVAYQPTGLLGELYWSVLYPFHVLLFDGMHEAIARDAQRRSRSILAASMSAG